MSPRLLTPFFPGSTVHGGSSGLIVYAGIRNVDSQLIEAGESLGLSRSGLIRHVVLPGALPGALTGLRYSLGIAWLALVFAEQVNADSGIGLAS